MASKKEYGIEEHIYETLLDLHKLECSEAFRFPVDTVTCKCPDYYNIIKDPMDLSTLTTNYKDGLYKTIDDIKAEVMKIIRNCRTFNSDPTHVIHKTCDKFEKCYYSRWNKLDELRISLGVPDNYLLQIQMNKLDLIEQRRNKKKEPALLKDMPRQKRQTTFDSKQFANSFTITKPVDQPMPRQIKIKSSSIQDDDQPFIDSNQYDQNSRMESQQFQDFQKISFKKPSALVMQEQKEILETSSFKIQLQRPDIGIKSESILPKQPIQNKNIVGQSDNQQIEQQQPIHHVVPEKIPTIQPHNTFKISIPKPQIFPKPEPIVHQQSPPFVLPQQQPEIIPEQIQTLPSQPYQPLSINQQLTPVTSFSPLSQHLPPPQQHSLAPQQQLPIIQQQLVIPEYQLHTIQQQPQTFISPSLQQPQEIKPIPETQQIIEEHNNKNIIKQQPDQSQELNMKLPVNNLPKINIIENKHSNSDSKISLSKPQQQHASVNPSKLSQPSLKFSDKPQIPKVTFKQETPNTPKQKRKVIDSDSDDMEKIEQIPIIKKNSEKKLELSDTPLSNYNFSAPIGNQSSEKKSQQPLVLNPVPVVQNELDNKSIGQQIELLQQQKEASKQVQQQPKVDPPAPKYIFKIDLNAVQKLENENSTKKMEKNRKFSQKIMASLKKCVMNRQPQIEILNKSTDMPSLTSLAMILLWLKNDFDKFSFQEFSIISNYVQLAYKCISKTDNKVDPQCEQLLQQCFDKEREAELIRIRKQEQELKAQNEPIILEKIDIEQLYKTLRVRQKKKKGSEKGKENEQQKDKDNDIQQQLKSIDVQPFSLNPIKKIHIEQQSDKIEVEEEDDENTKDEQKDNQWWKTLAQFQKNGQKQINEEQMNKEEQKETKKTFILRTLDQVIIQKTLQLGDQQNVGQFPKIIVEKMYFYLLNRESKYYGSNKSIISNFFSKLKDPNTINKDIYSSISKSKYYIDENHSELFEIYKIDNYAEILIKLTLQDQDSFDPQLIEQKLNIKLNLQNILSYISLDNFVNAETINQSFQLRMAQYSRYISEPILRSKLYNSNEIFVESLITSKMNKETGFGMVICNRQKMIINQKFEYSCQIQLLIPFTFVEDLRVSLNDITIFNMQSM